MRAMPQPSANPSASDLHSRRAALALGLSLPGDTVLYLLPPMFAPAFGVTLFEAGILLAANRLVRIAGYGAVARFYARHGERLTCSLAVLAAAACALGYATLSGFIALLGLRLLWGLAFAALTLATQALATAEPLGAARRAGQSRAFAALGPMLALPAGGVCALWWEPRAIFFAFAAVALCALLATRHLPAQPHALPPPPKRWGRLPGRLDRFSFVEGLVLDGLFIIGLSYLGRDVLPGHPVVVAGLLLSVRYLAEIVLSAVGGGLAERYGAGAHPGAGDAVGLAGPGRRCGPGAGGGAPAHCAVRLGVWRRSLAAVGHGHRLLGASRRWISHAAATAPFSQTSALENCP